MNNTGNIVKKGTTILTNKPFAYIVSSACKNNRCEHCLKSGKLLKCSGCQYVYYCDRNCQKESWPVHKSECANLKRVSPKIVPDAARLMARIIVKLNKGGADEIGYYTDNSFRKFKDLMSHYTDIKNDEKRMEQFVCLCGVLFEYLRDTPLPNAAELIGIYGRICINSFNITDMDMNTVGVGIYLGASVIDHSCNPNAIATFDGPNIIIRTSKDLPVLDWSQIRITYIDVLTSTTYRRNKLLSTYYFSCDCKRCKPTEPTAEEAAACPNPSCTSPCSIIDDQCEKCGTQLSEDFKETFQEVSDFTAHNLERMKTVAYLDVSKLCLEKQRGILHRFNVYHLKTLEMAHMAAIKLEYWEDAVLYGEELIPGYLLYYGETCPLTGLLYFHIGKLLFLLNRSKEAFISLNKADTILSITHGDKHPLMKEFKRLFSQVIMKTSCDNE